MNTKTSKKIQIAKNGADLYLKNTRFTMTSLAAASEIEVNEIYEYFPNRRSVLEFFYESVIIEYREITKKIDGYQNFSLAEKLSNLALTVIDLLGEHKQFTAKTYRRLIVCSSRTPEYNRGLKDELRSIYENDARQSAVSSALNSNLLYKTGVMNFHILINLWLNDESEGDQKTMELVDKWTAFVEEIHYNCIIDRGFELAKFAFYNLPYPRCNTGTSKKEAK
ncbi:hypothetical protein DYD21_18580 [Rhodohalobacter sp. SW132]|uniref:hypothetical protein n=1 Tax=Rhodohalobacter sp. SW132 TaxID=2293433 RepID=UPI000E267C3F|nr:hypothetical protein [Rhodohalobacter sp. SW132]REL24593.1 hypothetical protein DYD21_18580 [Rhodohalobacter sp. SW132]